MRRAPRERRERAPARPRGRGRTSPAPRATATRIEVFANLGSARTRRARSSSAPRASGCCGPSSCSSTAPSCPARRSRPRRCARSPRALDGRPLIVRTLDAGADKPLPALPMPPEANPFLGVRGIRLALAAPGRARHAVPRDPPRGRRVPGQGDAADGGHARRDRGRPRGCSIRPAPRPGSTRRSSSGSWSRSRRRADRGAAWPSTPTSSRSARTTSRSTRWPPSAATSGSRRC